MIETYIYNHCSLNLASNALIFVLIYFKEYFDNRVLDRLQLLKHNCISHYLKKSYNIRKAFLAKYVTYFFRKT